MKSLAKYILCIAAYYTGLASLYRMIFRRRRPVVLTYHRVVPWDDSTEVLSQPGMIVTPSTFESQMDYLREEYTIIPLREMVDRIGDGRLDAGLCSVTFDDGWRDVYVHAYPILRSRGIPATVFLATGYVGADRLFWPERVLRALSSAAEPDEAWFAALAEIDGECAMEAKAAIASADPHARLTRLNGLIEMLKRLDAKRSGEFVELLERSIAGSGGENVAPRSVLDWSEVNEMNMHGISFGSHTVNHTILTCVSPEEARAEIFQSKETLAEKLGEVIDLFAYPNGDWNHEVRDMVEEAGYKGAVITTARPRDRRMDSFLIDRLTVHEGMSVKPRGGYSRAVFACEVCGLLGALRAILGRRHGAANACIRAGGINSGRIPNRAQRDRKRGHSN